MGILILVLLTGLIVASLSVLYLASRVGDLPLPHAAIGPFQGTSRGLVILFSGPTGWLGFEQDLAEELSTAQFDVRGVDYLRYFFWKKRTPAQLAEVLSQLILNWRAEQGRLGPVLLVGYSKGADVLPFAANLLAPDLRENVELVALISISRLADFRLRLSEVFKGGYGPFALKVGPEIKKLESVPGLCIYGSQDRVSLCRNLKGISNTMEVREVEGNRTFHNAKKVAELILTKYNQEQLKRTEASALAPASSAPDASTAENSTESTLRASAGPAGGLGSAPINPRRPPMLKRGKPSSSLRPAWLNRSKDQDLV